VGEPFLLEGANEPLLDGDAAMPANCAEPAANVVIVAPFEVRLTELAALVADRVLSHLGEREVGEGDDVQRGGFGVLWLRRSYPDGERGGWHAGMGRVEKLCSKPSGARAWTPDTRSAMAPGSPAAGKQSCNAAISRQDRCAMLAEDSREARSEIRWTASVSWLHPYTTAPVPDPTGP
jgi:hypothetical protein